MNRITSIIATLGAAALISSLAVAAPPPPGAVHVRGTIQSLKAGLLKVSTSSGVVPVHLTLKLPVVSVIPSDRAHVKDGAFLGIASVPGAGGVQQAREGVIFPEAARGTGEGSYDWDLPGAGVSKMTNGTANRSRMTNGTARMTNGTAAHSRMTNGTVSGAGSSQITLVYKSGNGKGSQKLTLPAGIPFVTFAPGNMSQLVPGAHVVVFGHRDASGIRSDRVLVGKNGLVPPM